MEAGMQLWEKDKRDECFLNFKLRKQKAKEDRHVALGVALLVHIECGWNIAV
jgi:hypothetical protein